MIGPFRAQRRRIDLLGRAVREDMAALAADGGRLADHIRQELGRPKVLLAIFAAGLGYGWVRRSSKTDSAQAGAPGAGALARLAAALAAGIRLYEQAHRAAAIVEPLVTQAPGGARADGGLGESAPSATEDPSGSFAQGATEDSLGESASGATEDPLGQSASDLAEDPSGESAPRAMEDPSGESPPFAR